MPKVIFYMKNNCSLCDDARGLLSLFQDKCKFELEERDIYTNDAWLEEYQLLIPCVEIAGTRLDCEHLNMETLEQALNDNR